MQIDPIIILTIVGITFLLFSIRRTFAIISILRDNVYDWKLWVIIILMLLGFIAGYTILVFQVLTDFSLPISLELVVALVYFFGSIFTLVTTGVVKGNLVNILGETISVEEALDRFIRFADLPPNHRLNLQQQYTIVCENCKNQILYSIVDIIRTNVVALDRGISIEDIFGTKTYIFRPSHKCTEGRREYTIVHDKDLEIRSIEGSRLIYGGNI